MEALKPLLSRKFIFGMTLAILGAVALFTGKTDFREWATFEAIIGATYVVGNIGGDVADKLNPMRA